MDVHVRTESRGMLGRCFELPLQYHSAVDLDLYLEVVNRSFCLLHIFERTTVILFRKNNRARGIFVAFS